MHCQSNNIFGEYKFGHIAELQLDKQHFNFFFVWLCMSVCACLCLNIQGKCSSCTELNKARHSPSLSITILGSICGLSCGFGSLTFIDSSDNADMRWFCNWCLMHCKSLQAPYTYALCPVSTMDICVSEPWRRNCFEWLHRAEVQHWRDVKLTFDPMIKAE